MIIGEINKLIMKKIKYSDCKFNFTEYKVDRIGNVVPMKSYNIRKIKTFGLYKEKDVAEAVAYLPRLIRLRDHFNGDWQPDYKDGSDKYAIKVDRDEIVKDVTKSSQYLLVFKTQEIRDFYLENYLNIIVKTKKLL